MPPSATRAPTASLPQPWLTPGPRPTSTHQPRAQVEPARQYAKWFDGQNATLRADLEAAQSALRLPAKAGHRHHRRPPRPLKTPASPSSRPSSRWLQAQKVTPLAPGAIRFNADNLPEVMQNGSSMEPQRPRPISPACARKASATSLAGRLGKTTPRSPAAGRNPANLRGAHSAAERAACTASSARHHPSRVIAAQQTQRIRDQGRPRSPDRQRASVAALKAAARPTGSPCCSATSKTPGAPTTSSPSARPDVNLESRTQQTNVVVRHSPPSPARTAQIQPRGVAHTPCSGRVPRWPPGFRLRAAARAHGPVRLRGSDRRPAQITGMPVQRNRSA